MSNRTIAAGAILAVALSSATALASADAATISPRTSSKAGAYTVTASVNKTEPLVGTKIKIKGSVKPAAPGAKVILQLQYADQKSWKTVGTDTLNSAGKFRFKDKVSSVRTRKYRVVKRAGPNRAAGHSKSLKVVVYGWRDLTSLSPATASNMYEVSSVAMNGVVYPNSLRADLGYPPPGTTGSIEYNLNRGCKAFKGTVGLDDSSTAAGKATIALATDGTQRYSGSFALTQSAAVAFDVTNVFRLSIGTLSTGNGIGAVGTPQVLCNS